MLTRLKVWCRHSLTILWARIQYFGGVAGAGLVAAFSGYDFTQLVSMDWRAAFKMLLALAVAGVLTEFARRRSLPTVDRRS
jgi:hypothetical protein